MFYFESLPTLSYNGTELRDIFKKITVEKNIPDDFITYYRIPDDNNSLTKISYKLYGTPDYWWILALLNEITDLYYDLPINNKILTNIARDNTFQRVTLSSMSGIAIGSTLTGNNSGRSSVINNYIQVDSETYLVDMNVIKYPFNNDTILYSDFSYPFTLSATITQTKWYTNFNNNLTELAADNDAKRVIKIFRKDALTLVIADINRKLGL
jgi:hypothetical protein